MHANLNKKTTGADLSAFQTIVDFVTNLHECFGIKNETFRPLILYNRLVQHLSFKDDELILQHLKAFKTFCVENREAIRNRNTQLNHPKIEFSERIYINMHDVFHRADEETTQVIWQYIFAISAYLDPENNTKQLLQTLQTTDNTMPAGLPMDMISGLMNNLGSEMGGTGDADPMSLISGLMSSPLFSQLLGSLNTKDMDIGSLIQSMSGLVNNVKSEIEKSDDPNIKNLLDMVSSMVPPPDSASSDEQDVD